MSKMVKLHEEKYWHIPKFGLLPLFGLVVFGFLALANLGLLDLNFLDVELAKNFVFKDLVLVYPFVAENLFVSGFFVSLVALFKGGYGELKPLVNWGFA